MFETLSAGNGKEEEDTCSNPAVVGVVDRVKTLAAQGSDGSFSGVRVDDILTAALETAASRSGSRRV
jgi:hypothetical protein